MRIRYDAKEIAESIENMSCEFGRYRTNADILEEQYEKYCRNDTYIGLAAKASKKFIGEGQMKLHYENLEIQKMILDRYMAIEDDFKSMVDASPEARIDTDALKENSDHFEKQLEYLDRIGRRVEDRSDYVIEKFGKYNSDITRASYSCTRMSYDEECEYIAKCIKTVREFDELSLCAVQNSGMAECISDLQDDITRTTMVLGLMKAYEPKMDKVELNLLPQGGAPKAMTMLSTSKGKNNVQLKKLSTAPVNTVAGSNTDPMLCNISLDPATVSSIEKSAQQIIMEMGYSSAEMEEIMLILGPILAAIPEVALAAVATGLIIFIIYGAIDQYYNMKQQSEIRGHVEPMPGVTDIPAAPKDDNNIIIEDPGPQTDKPTITPPDAYQKTGPNIETIPDKEGEELGGNVETIPEAEQEGAKIEESRGDNLQNSEEKLIGEDGTQTNSTTTWNGTKKERIDVENPNPGVRAGQIHYHDANNVKYYYDIEENEFYDPKTGESAPRSVNKKLEDKDFMKGIEKGLKILGE